jgi:hypothetical protein
MRPFPMSLIADRVETREDPGQAVRAPTGRITAILQEN